jgi:peptidoglycan hydrolase-like protein with peptidoglycan-binding domain
MRRLLLATASVVALGLGGGLAFAAGNTNSNAGTNAGSNMPAATGTAQPGYNPGTGANTGASYGTGTSGYTQGTNANTGMSGMNGSSQWGGGHNQVMEVQQKLQADNLYSGKIDGMMGPETRQALRQYQQQNGLPATARLDRQTLDRILGNGATGQGSSTPPGTSHMPQTNSPPSR